MSRLAGKKRSRSRVIACVIFAFAIHTGFLGLLTITSPRQSSGPQDLRAFSVDLVTLPRIAPNERPRSSSRAAPPGPSSISSPAAGPAHPFEPPANAIGAPPQPAAPAPTTPQDTSPLGPALRHGIIGCSFAGLVALSEAERSHCRDVFAAGAKSGRDFSRFALAPGTKAAFDAAAGPGNFLQGAPKNGCKLFAKRPKVVTLGGEAYDASAAFGCGRTF